MKKCIPAFLTLLVVIFSLSSVVSATGTTTYTAEDYNFSFTYSSTVNEINVTWNAPEGVSVTDVLMDGNPAVINGDRTSKDFSVSYNFIPGYYNLYFKLSNGQTIPSSVKVECAGELKTKMTVDKENGSIGATLTDSYGKPVANYPITLLYAGQTADGPKTTDDSGHVVFAIAAPSDQTEVSCVAEDQTVTLEASGWTINYTGCSKSLTSVVTTTTSKRTTTTKAATTASSTKPHANTSTAQTQPTQSQTTASTYAVISGAGTTSVVSGNQIALNVSFDTQVAKDFDLSNSAFDADARLIMSKDLYASIVGDTKATLMLLAKTSSLTITDDFISTAISNKSKYSLYSAQDALRVPLDLSLLFVDSAQKVNTVMALPQSDVTVVLPVPKAMSDTTKYTVIAAVCNKNGITKLLDTKVDNGSLQFKTNSLSSVVIIGFKSPYSAVANNEGIPFIALAMIIVGVLMLGSAFLLLYFFFLRKPIPEEEETDEGNNAVSSEGDNNAGSFDNDDRLPPSVKVTDSSVNDSNASYENIQSSSTAYRSSSDSNAHSGNAHNEETPRADSAAHWEPGPNDIFSSSTHDVPGVSLGSLRSRPEQNDNDDKPAKKNPSDYDIDL